MLYFTDTQHFFAVTAAKAKNVARPELEHAVDASGDHNHSDKAAASVLLSLMQAS